MRIVSTTFLAAVLVAVVASAAVAFNVVQEPLPKGAVGQAYDYQFKVASGDPVTNVKYGVLIGSLPPGLTLSSSGRLTGTPTQQGGWKFDVQACLPGPFCSERTFELGILPRLWVTTETVPAGTVGAPYSVALQSQGSTVTEWTLTAGQLPPGLTMTSAGVIAGTPTTPGTWQATVKVSDRDIRFDLKQLTLVVAEPLVAAEPLTPPAVVGTPFALPLAAVGGTAPYAWAFALETRVPPGLVLDPATGILSGTPRLAGSFPLTATVKDASGITATVALTLDVARKLKIVTRRLPFVVRGNAYRSQVALRGGIAPFRLKVTDGRLPRGIRMNTRNGRLIGKARTKPGKYRFTVTATDRLRGSISRTLVIVVKAPPKKRG